MQVLPDRVPEPVRNGAISGGAAVHDVGLRLLLRPCTADQLQHTWVLGRAVGAAEEDHGLTMLKRTASPARKPRRDTGGVGSGVCVLRFRCLHCVHGCENTGVPRGVLPSPT